MNPKSYSYYDGEEKKWIASSEDLFTRLMGKVREVFDVKEFKDGGLTQAETLELLSDFIEYKRKKVRS